MLKGKHILLGVTGSIAAYKAATIVRLLIKNGAEVKVIMTPLAKEFITPLTLATLSKNPICVEFFNPENGDWNSHVDMGSWADAYLIAPATANTIGKMANGIADNLLLTTYLSAKCPVFIAPAMDLDMFRHKTVQDNLITLKSMGVHIIEPTSGELASGLEGKGRMEEPEKIILDLEKFFEVKKKLKSKKILVTAGPTHEDIDPVRYIGNHSSGKMGFAIAEALAAEGASVVMVCGPVSIAVPQHPEIKIINVRSAEQMYQECIQIFPTCNAAVMCAAVADYTPVKKFSNKIKRSSEEMSIALKPNKDIAAELGRLKKKSQVLVGFALETDNGVENATLKMKKKNLDFIVLNSLSEESGFSHDTNKISIIDSDNKTMNFPLKHKKEVASDIVNTLIGFIK